MTNSDKIERVRVMSGLSADELSDASIAVYLDAAAEKVLNRCYPSTNDVSILTVPDRYAGVQCEVALYNIIKRGADLESAHKEGDVTRTYDSEESILKQIVPFAHVLTTEVVFDEAT